jgi:hypothetical protein
LSSSPSALVTRFLGCFLVTGLFVAALAAILPGRPSHAFQFARAEVLWQSAPGERVRFSTEYVDARICRNLPTARIGTLLGSEQVEVACHVD